jgi:hypothetical protein
MAFFRLNWREIEADTVLRRYGAALALLGPLTAAFWAFTQPLSKIINPSSEPICWPFLGDCVRWRVFDEGRLVTALALLATSGVVAAYFFLRAKSAAFAYWLLVAGFVLKTTLVLQDYRLVLNQHYMAAWVTLSFLFVPSKRNAVRYLVVLFYVWAGLLKLNGDWLSGENLYGSRPFGMPASWIPLACAYVIGLEVVIVPLLLLRRRWIFWAVFFQVCIFHLGSFWVVGYFYPLLMYLALSIFPLDLVEPRPVTASVPTRLPTGRRWAVGALLAIFCACQLVPRFLSRRPSVTGEGRLFALNMLDSALECQGTLTYPNPDQTTNVQRIRVPYLERRLACDPVVYFEVGRARCLEPSRRGKTDDFDLRLKTRAAGTTTFEEIVSISDFCGSESTYSIWRHNSWVAK